MKARCYFLILLVAPSLLGQVTYDQILNARSKPQNWFTYSGAYDGKRFSPLKQINRTTVKALAPAWVFQSSVLGKFEATPLVIDRVMYVTAPDNVAFAVDANTGRTLWKYVRALPEKVQVCCGRVNRGFAAMGDRLFLATLDAHVVALDRRSGNVLWDVEAADYKQGYSFTVAPLALQDKVIVGVSGGEYPIRGFIDAYDIKTGQRIWRFHTIPAPNEPGGESWTGDSWKIGGSPAWVTGSYDPTLDLIYWGTGNPAPSNNGSERAGDNLYSNSVVALESSTGKLRWYYQFTPHDAHDWDAAQTPILVDLAVNGEQRKLLVTANRNGFFYALDRTNGKFLFAKPFMQQTWAREIDANGKAVLLPGADPTAEGVRVCPGAIGGTNFMAPSYNPETGLFYFMAREQCDVFTVAEQVPREGRPFIGSVYVPEPRAKDWGAVRALDPRTGERKWEFRYMSAAWAGTLTTAGGLVFAGDIDGYLIAFDAKTGKELWHFQTGAPIYAAPISYSVSGKQYVALASGTALIAFALPGDSPGKPAVPGTQQAKTAGH